MGKQNVKTDTGAGPTMQVPQPVEVIPRADEKICPFISGGLVMHMSQSRPTVLSQGPPQVMQQPLRYYMACVRDKCAVWDGAHECCGLLTVNAEGTNQ